MRKTIDGVTVDVFSVNQKIVADYGKHFRFLEETKVKSSNIYNVKAMDEEQQRVCFLKFARYDSDGFENWQIKNLRREGAFQFQCPYIEKIYESFTGIDPDGKKVYCVAVEYIEGMNLLEYCKNQKRLMKEGLLTEEKYEQQMFRNMLQLLYGVRYYMNFSADAYLHRDLKPENIMVDKKGNLVIVDFDYAHITGSKHTENSESWGLALSRGYTDPRTLKGIVPDKMSDVYSIGRILFYWMNGYPYYRNEELESNLYCKSDELGFGLDESRLSLKYMTSNYEKLRKILRKACTDPGKEKRYKDADEILDDLEEFILEYYGDYKDKEWYIKIKELAFKRRKKESKEKPEERETLCSIVIDGSLSFSRLFPQVYYLLENEIKKAHDSVVKYGLTVFHNENFSLQTLFANGDFFTDDIEEFLESLRSIEFFGGSWDGREDFSSPIRQAMECLRSHKGEDVCKGLMFFSDSLPKEEQIHEEFSGDELSFALFYIYSNDFFPVMKNTRVQIKSISDLLNGEIENLNGEFF